MIIPLYRALGWAIAPLVDQWLKARMRRGKEDPARAEERRGHAGVPRPPGRLVWFHGASVGEMVSVLAVIDRIRRDYPEISVLVTSGTVTSAEMAAQRLPERCIHQYVPADIPGWIGRFLDHWRPDAAFWVESELWPGLVTATHARGIPMVLLNARISLTSFKRWRWLPGFRRSVIGAFDLVLARSDLAAERFEALGARSVKALGDLKLAALPLPVDQEALAELREAVGDRPVFLAASTHDGEEQAAIKAHIATRERTPDLLTVIVPRHPLRGDDIHFFLASCGYEVARRSAGDVVTGKTDFYLADTLGELGLFFTLAQVAFIGASLTPKGGHNPLEAAPFDVAILMGPDRRNNQRPAEVLDQAGALLVVDTPEELAIAVAGLFAHPERVDLLKDRVKHVMGNFEAVLDSTLTMISPYIEGEGTRAGQGPGHKDRV